jgi:CheY-like chemotaxis protein
MAHILLIDDDDLVREVIRSGLERSGHHVFEASDGKKGLAAHQATPVDLVITDIIMPGMEGLETIIKFRRQYPNLKVIAISGGGMGKAGDYLTLAAKFGAHRTVAKPFSIEKLSNIAGEVLQEN